MSFTREAIANDNICAIWVDDMIDVFHWRTAFGEAIKTPNIDRILNAGVRFSNCYATIPLCSPCRAELATGLSPFRTGLVDLNRIWREVLPPEKSWLLDLRAAGFRLFSTGKVDGKYKPMEEEYRRMLLHDHPAAGDRRHKGNVHIYQNKGPDVKGINGPNDDGSADHEFYDWAVAENAIKHLQRVDPNRRHLIQLGFKHPHTPFICPDRFYQMYDADKIHWPHIACPEDLTGPQPGMAVYEHAYIVNGRWIPESIGEAGWREVVRGYFAACSHVDHEIGRFFDALTASPIGDCTTVVFLSDNGFNLGTHDSFHKMSQWDSAAHIPLGIWSPRMEQGRVIDLPVSLHNYPKTIMDLAGLPPRPDWVSGQSLLPLIDESFGAFDRSKSPVTSVFGTLSVRPSCNDDLSRYRYFRYPNGEEHVYDLVSDPGETRNLAALEPDNTPMAVLRDELVRGAAELGLDLSGLSKPGEVGMEAMFALDGSVVLAGGARNNHYWAYGEAASAIAEDVDGGDDTLWYMGGPDDFVLHCPMNVETVRIATVKANEEAEAELRTPKTINVVAHPNTPIHFETSERVEVNVTGSRGGDVIIGPKYGALIAYGGAGDDQIHSLAKGPNNKPLLYGGTGDDFITAQRGVGQFFGGTGNDRIMVGDGAPSLFGGHGNDHLEMGEGPGEIHTGPGRNIVRLGKGDQKVFVGPGRSDVYPGIGGVVIHVAWGSVCIVHGWRPRQRYDLSAWPMAPQIHSPSPGVVDLKAGSTILRVTSVAEGRDIYTQIIWAVSQQDRSP